MDYKSKYFELKTVFETGIAIKQSEVLSMAESCPYDLYDSMFINHMNVDLIFGDILYIDGSHSHKGVDLEFGIRIDFNNLPSCYTEIESLESVVQFDDNEIRDEIFKTLVEVIETIEFECVKK